MFQELDKKMVKEFETYTDNGICTAVVLGKDSFTEKVIGKKDEKLLLAFPDNSRHKEECGQFLRFIGKKG